jgi:hypothetical protein
MGRTANGLRWPVRVYTRNIRCMAIEIALVLLITFGAVRIAEFGPGGWVGMINLWWECDAG